MPSSTTLFDLALDLCWGQWSALGVAGVRRQRGRAIIDPEALIPFTAAFSDRDPRLRDEAIDWCVSYGPSVVSTSRMKTLLRDMTHPLVDRFLATVNLHSSARWPTSRDAAPWRTEPSGKSRLPRPDEEPALSRIQLRALFGVGARAEVLLALLRDPDARNRFVSASGLQFIGYSKRTIAFLLEDLERASLLQRRKVGNQVHYRLMKANHLENLVPCVKAALFVRWELVFSALLKGMHVVQSTAAAPPSIRSIEMRNFVTRLQPTWDALGVVPPAPVRGGEDEFHATATDWLTHSLVPPDWR